MKKCQRRPFHFFGFCLGLALTALLSPLAGREKAALDEELQQFQASNILFGQGLSEFERGEIEKASVTLEKCLQKMPRHAFAHYYLANLFYIQKEFPKALSHMEQSLAEYDHMVELSDRADQLKLENLEAVQQSIESLDGTTGSCRDSRSAEFFGSQIADKELFLQEAGKRRRQAQERMKGHYVYFYGNVLFQLRRIPEAVQQYEEAVRINPKHANAHNNLIGIYYAAKIHSKAIEYLDRAEREGLDEILNLKLKEMVYKAVGRPTAGILEEAFSPQKEGGPEVLRFALAVRPEGSSLPPLYENCYVVIDPGTGQAVIIDPGVEDPRIQDFIRARKLEVKAVLNTHGHADHRGGNKAYSSLYGAPVWAPKDDHGLYDIKPDQAIQGGNTLELGSLKIQVLATPGHTPGSVCFLFGDSLFSGDTLFKNDIGKIDAADKLGVPELRKKMIGRIRESLLPLPGEVRVFPGHGKTTRISDEKEDNPFLK